MGELPTSTNTLLAQHAAAIRNLGKRVVADIILIGERLTECKGLAGHGHWLPWLEREFGWTDKTAARLMQVYELAQTSKFDKLSDLNLPVSGLYLLAAPSTPEPARTEVVERAKSGEKITHATVKETVAKHKSKVDKQQRRAEREAELGAAQSAGNLALPQKRYGVILADPEWRFEPYSRDTGMDRAADNHYPTSPLETIKQRDIASIAADDCVLFLWATVPMLPQALEVMAAWGFRYRTNFSWTKDRIGTGYWNRNKHEHLLIGTQGNPPAPAMGTQFESVIEASRGRHSEKPEIAYELIEAYFPNLPKIELNARQRRSGWDAWGDEIPYDAADDLAGSINVAYEAIRERVANGGPGYTPPPVESDDIPTFLDRRKTQERPLA